MCKKLPRLQISYGALVVVLSAPNSGKNTFIQTLVGEDERSSPIFHIDTGGLIRERANPEHVKITSSGKLVNDTDTFEIIQGHFGENYQPARHLVTFLNGFPRNPKQVNMLDNLHVGEKFLLHLSVSDKTATDRFFCGLNDKDRADRKDTDLETFKGRLADYRKNEPRVLQAARLAGVKVIKCRIDRCPHTSDVARGFQERYMQKFFVM